MTTPPRRSAALPERGRERLTAALLFSWFFLVITTLWLLKPIRQASLLAHLGSSEIPAVRLGSVLVVALVVAGYSRLVDRLSRLQVAAGASLLFSGCIVLLWAALRIGGDALGAERPFVWSVFILVDVYSTVLVGIFWTYTNDVVTREQADRLYGPIGLGGIVGGIAGGATVDGLVRTLGHVDLLLLCAALGVMCAAIVGATEHLLRPAPRVRGPSTEGAASMWEGARAVGQSRYLLLLVCIVVGYEFAAALTDYVVSVIFERAFDDQDELAQMFGRLGWVVSGTALAVQLAIVPLLLPQKRVALLVAPIAMAIGTALLLAVPTVPIAFFMSTTDRGLNYSLQQVTKETLYVPLTDLERYKSKAFIDMVVDRGGKALSALALLAILATQSSSVTLSLSIALGALAVWTLAATALGAAYASKVTPERSGAAGRLPSLRPRAARGRSRRRDRALRRWPGAALHARRCRDRGAPSCSRRRTRGRARAWRRRRPRTERG
jgi:AAA family ATP:ADP antiporter